MIQCLRSSLWQGVDQSPVKWLSGLLPNRWHKASEVRVPTLVCVQTLHQNFPRLGRTQIGLWNQCLDLWLFITNSFLKVICPRERAVGASWRFSPTPFPAVPTPHYKGTLTAISGLFSCSHWWLLMLLLGIIQFFLTLLNVFVLFCLTEKRKVL